MKQKILINYPMDELAVEKIQKRTPDLLVTANGEQILAMVRLGEVDRICIIFGAYRFFALDLSKAIHEIDPTIPVLIMALDIPENPSVREYVTTNAGFFFESVNEFLNGDFKEEDYQVFPKKNSYY